MDRMACVDIADFPIQLLVLRHPDWEAQPVAVVEADRPQGIVLGVNERARASRILPGMRYAAALSLAGGLRAAVVSPTEIEQAVAALGERLRGFTPHVEPVTEEPGVFWLDASGFDWLYHSSENWASLIRADLERGGFRATVAVGFNRFFLYAIAKAGCGVVVFETEANERAAARPVSIDRLAIEPAARESLKKLGITTVGAFVDLPLEGLEKRFGQTVRQLHRLASGDLRIPLQPERPTPPAVQQMILDYAESDLGRLMEGIERLLDPLLDLVRLRGNALAEVSVGLRFERLGNHVETVRPAEPTLDADLILELIRLRLESMQSLPEPVVEVELSARDTKAIPLQPLLIAQRPPRDLTAANRALARIRAELGEDAVVCARLREGHLPEGRFTWEPLGRLEAPRPHHPDAGWVVRRMFSPAIFLSPNPRNEPESWMLRGLSQGPVLRWFGPHIVAGGWWHRTVHREYYFAETQRGDLLWIYYDRVRRRWFLQGRVE